MDSSSDAALHALKHQHQHQQQHQTGLGLDYTNMCGNANLKRAGGRNGEDGVDGQGQKSFVEEAAKEIVFGSVRTCSRSAIHSSRANSHFLLPSLDCGHGIRSAGVSV